MKSAIYLSEGETQLILTPENDWEKNILKTVHESYPDTWWGGFYACQGGWIRETRYDSEKDSLMFRLPKQADIKPEVKYP